MGATVTLAATTTSGAVKLGGQPTEVGARIQVRIVNPGTTVAYVRFGNKDVAAATAAADVPILPGTSVIFTVTAPEKSADGTFGAYASAVLASGTATLSFTTGVGIS
jgi:hypothetical protein